MPKITRLCIICSKPFHGRTRGKYCGFACAHIARTIPIANRFWGKVQKTDDLFSCWEWVGTRSKRGYGYVATRGHSKLAHRVAFTLTYGAFDPTLNVLHRCDNPSCCRPSHLFLGTPFDNMRDMMVKGRHRSDKLTEPQVHEIRLAALHDETLTSISKRFNVALATISMIVNGITWKHVT